MRILQKIISTLLAAQLLFSFGLCGGLCCVRSAELPAQQIAIQAVEQDESLPPCHRKMAAEKAAANQDHQTFAANQNATGKIATSVLNRDCCAMKREAPESESPLSIFAPQSSKLIAVFVTSPWSGDEIVFGLPQVPIQILATHSPPHTGFQLSLRI